MPLRTGAIYNYSQRTDLAYSEILLPEHAPERLKNRTVLWNEVDQVEKASNARTARQIEFSLLKEFDSVQNIMLARTIAGEFVKEGMVADLTIHDAGNGNSHAHIMLTTRPFDENGNWAKKSRKEYVLDKDGNRIKLKSGAWKSYKVDTVDWNKDYKIEQWRERIADKINEHLRLHGFEQQVDHRSYKRQGKEQSPTFHLGSYAHRLEQQGIQTDRGNINRQIQEQNRQLDAINKELAELGKVREQELERQREEERKVAGQGKKKEEEQPPLSYAEKYKQATQRYHERKQQPDPQPSYEDLFKQPDQPKPHRPPDQNLSYAERYKQRAERHRLVRDPNRQPPRQYRHQEQEKPSHHKTIEHKQRSYEDLYKQTNGRTNQPHQPPDRKPSYEDLYKQPDQPKPQQTPDQNLSYAERYKQRADEVKRYHERIKRNKGKNKDDGYSRDR